MRRRERVYDISKHPVRYFFDQTWEATKAIGTLVKRFALIGLVVWGGQKYLTQNGKRSASEGLKAKIQAINNTAVMKNFRDGLGVIKDVKKEIDYANSPAGKEHARQVREIQQQRLKEYKEMGIDPTIHYLKPGDPGYKEELEFQRKLMRDMDR